jgi:signal transduction histidine kinase
MMAPTPTLGNAQPSPAHRWLRWLLAALILIGAIGLSLRIIVVAQRSDSYTGGEGFLLPFDWLLGFPAAAMLYVLVGALILQRQNAAHVIGRLCLLIGIGLTLADVLDGIGQLAISPLMAGWCAALSSLSIGIMMNLGIVVLLLEFPTGRYLSRRWRWIAILSATGLQLSLLQGALRSEIWLNNTRASVPNPLFIGKLDNIWRANQLADQLSMLAISISLITLLVATASIFVRWVRSDHTTRRQLQWLMLVMSITIVIFVAGGLAWQFMPRVDYFAFFIAGIVVMMLGTPVAIGIAILRHNLFDIDLIWNRALVYGMLTIVIVLAYGLIVSGVIMLLGLPLALGIAIVLVATALNPVRQMLQRSVNRLMYGQRDEPYQVLAQMSRQLEVTLTPNLALREMVRTISESLKLPYVAVIADETIIAHGTLRAGASVVNFPLRHQHELLGDLRVSPRAGESLSDKDRQLLHNLSLQAGMALHSAQLNADLQRSREQLVNAREEERRRLRRNLHDGLGPTLASQTLMLDAAMDLLRTDPDKAGELLAQLKRQTQATVSDVRHIVYELRPAALDEHGLAGAIRNYAASINGLAVNVHAPAKLPPLPAAVEVAAYFIITEAMTNVIRHAHASECDVRIEMMDASNVLRIEAEDNGKGLREDRNTGVGLRSMRERAEELGGTLRIESTPGKGLSVTAELPI